MVKFLGIWFRSSEHVSWFKGTQCMLGVCLLLFGLAMRTDVQNRDKLALSVSFACGFVFLMMFFLAVIFTKGGRIEDNGFSRDCIWYNFLLAVICGAMALLLQVF